MTAPFDGVVTERTAHEGSLVSPSAGPIVRMQQVSRLRVVAAIPEAYVAGAASASDRVHGRDVPGRDVQGHTRPSRSRARSQDADDGR